MQDSFGEPITTYSRAQAIEDGVLANVSATADAKGLSLWELAKGKERSRIKVPTKMASSRLGFSPDGRWHHRAANAIMALPPAPKH
ncbi:MAG TPA: hypothetical protein VG013_41845 [Gemmataceae bacterium]|jgi:hypothetical protein|nr:hypothetical protein [Gemmataceae bacterium]